MKKILALLLVLVLAFAFAACKPTETDEEPTERTRADGVKPSAPTGTFTVGTPEMNGNFIYGFGNNSYDKYIKDLTGGAKYYDNFTTTAAGEIVQNTVVCNNITNEEDADGNKTYTFSIEKDLLWSDGSVLNAKDYVFALLFQSNPAWKAVGATYPTGDSLVGYAAYTGGESDVFAGVQLIDEYTFSLTIAKENLPYFYEPSLVTVAPVCMASWAPGCDIESSEAGAKLVNIEWEAVATRVHDEELFAPSVTCGPYMFESFVDQICTLKVNPNFKTDLDGNKPNFEYVVVKSVNQDTDHEALINGEIDMVTGMIEGEKIEAIKASEATWWNDYLRCGYGLVAFHCDWGVTADVNVRWAMACLIDRQEVVNYVLGGYGGTVDSEYGLSQWMYQEKKAELAEKITPIAFNVDQANTYLDKTDWKFEADGTTPFDASKAVADGSYLRHNAAGEPLVVKHLGTTENRVTDVIEIQFSANCPLAGIKFEITKGDFNLLLDNYYYGFELGEDRQYNQFNLATNFTPVFDPYYSSNHSDFIGTDYNSNQISDPELDRLIMELRSIEPGNNEAFANKWVEYQVRWNQLLPNLPLYSNQYFDAFAVNIYGVDTTPLCTWAETICTIYRSETPAA